MRAFSELVMEALDLCDEPITSAGALAVVLLAARGSAPGKLGVTAYLMAIAIYALIAILAIAPRIAGSVGLGAAPVRVEAVLLIVVVFAGVNVARLLLFEGSEPELVSRA